MRRDDYWLRARSSTLGSVRPGVCKELDFEEIDKNGAVEKHSAGNGRSEKQNNKNIESGITEQLEPACVTRRRTIMMIIDDDEAITEQAPTDLQSSNLILTPLPLQEKPVAETSSDALKSMTGSSL
nr:hypothetical protein CFP56_68646 [Quercus suber]